MIEKIKKRFTPLVLALVVLLSYGVLAFQQGYYWDDWAFSWTRSHLGFQGLINQFSVNRPLRAYWEALLTPLAGVSPQAWQLYHLLLRWATSLAVWKLLSTLWAEKKWQNALTALFFAVYPGFTQSPLAVTYQYFWSWLFLFLLSQILMLQALRSPAYRRLKFGVSLLFAGLALFGLEYLFGLELLRFFLLWFALSPRIVERKERLKKALLFYAPYFVLLTIYLFWRIFLYKNTIYVVETASFSWKGLWIQLTRTLPLVSLRAWLRVLSQPFALEDGLSPRLALVMGAVLLSLTGLLASYLKLLVTRGATSSSQKKAWDGEWLFLSIAALISAGIPFYAANFPVKLSFPEDRFTFSFILGVSLLLTWFFSLIRNETQRFTLAALAVALAVTAQIYNSDVYRREWRLQRLFARQLFWRAPQIAPKTLVLSEDTGFFPHNDDEAFGFLLNWAYNPQQTDRELDYDFFYLSARLGGDLPSLQVNQPIFKDHYSAVFHGTTDRILLLLYSPPSCLRIIDPVYDREIPLAPYAVDAPATGTLVLPRNLASAVSLSNPQTLISKKNAEFSPPTWLFGEEPERNWCYFFEKADLARQYGDWEKVAKLGDQAFAFPYAPTDVAEYAPFIEAYARLGRDDDARKLTEIAADKAPILKPMLCSLWTRLAEDGILGDDDALLTEMRSLLRSCPDE